MTFTPSQQETADALVHKYKVFDTLTSEHIDAQDLRGEELVGKLLLVGSSEIPEGCVLYKCSPYIANAINVEPAESVLYLRWSSVPIGPEKEKTLEHLDMAGKIEGAEFGNTVFKDSCFDNVTWDCTVAETLKFINSTLENNQLSLEFKFQARAAFGASKLDKCKISTRKRARALKFDNSTLSQIDISPDTNVAELTFTACEVSQLSIQEIKQTEKLRFMDSTLEHCNAYQIRARELLLNQTTSRNCTFEMSAVIENLWAAGLPPQGWYAVYCEIQHCKILLQSKCVPFIQGSTLQDSTISVRREVDEPRTKVNIEGSTLMRCSLEGGKFDILESQALECILQDSRIHLRGSSSLTRCEISKSIMLNVSAKSRIQDCKLKKVLVYDKSLESQGGTYFGEHSVVEDFEISDVEFERKHLTGTVIRRTTFKECTFRHISFEHASIEECTFIECTFENVTFKNTKLLNTTMIRGLLVGSPMSKSNIDISSSTFKYTQIDDLESISYISANAAKGSIATFLDTRCDECGVHIGALKYIAGEDTCDECLYGGDDSEDDSWD
jgi:uncharacterized protein YjbI with pentapeptide repeats